MDPLVSVIIPTFNGERHLGETLQSVFAQTYTALEVIVVDDGSTDGSANLAAAFGPGLRIVQTGRRGHPAARNRGIQAATGEFLSFLDHDDLWLPAKIASQLSCFQQDPGLDLVFGHIQNFFSDELPESERQRIAAPLHPVPGLLQGAMLARRRSFDRVGSFSESHAMGDFLEWYGRATLLGLRMHVQPETVLRRRLHATNFQRTHSHLRRQYLPTLKEFLDRRRAAASAEGK
jgi:glycosyltransferase involved in cell wall biosynthesis